MNSPLSQFDVMSVFSIFLKNYEVSITNLSMTIFFVLLLFYLIFFKFFLGSLIPNIWQKFLEMIFIFVYSLVHQQLGNKGLMYFPFVLTLFLFMLMLNLFSLLPFGFAVTSHFIWTIYFSLSICLGMFILGLLNFKLKFLKLFVPEVPLFLCVMMMPMELLSYMLSSFSLAMSLSANIMAGHMLVHMLADFIFFLCKMHKMIVMLPFIVLMLILILELGIACLQAYMFVTLMCMYLHDSIYLISH